MTSEGQRDTGGSDMSLGVAWEPLVTGDEARTLSRYRSQERVEPCACGGTLRAFPSDESIRNAVLNHQQTGAHRLWRARMETPIAG